MLHLCICSLDSVAGKWHYQANISSHKAELLAVSMLEFLSQRYDNWHDT